MKSALAYLLHNRLETTEKLNISKKGTIKYEKKEIP